MTLPSRPFRLGTRSSPLAMAQAHLVREALLAAHGWDAEAITLVPVVASGDKVLDRALAEIGGKALWTKELDAWLNAGEIDFAVHSMKDVETVRPEAFRIAAMLPRADVRDRLVGAKSLALLPKGARVGTSAPRRRAQLLRIRPDLEITLFRGNVQTRLARIERGEADATLLAAAGLARLGMDDVGVVIPAAELLPAPSQGAIGVESLAGNEAVCALIAAIDDQPTHACVAAERALLAELSGDCQSPVAALAFMEAGAINLRAQIFACDGGDMVEGSARFEVADIEAPVRLARRLLAGAPRSVLEAFGR